MGPNPTPCGYSAHLLPHHCCPHQALLSQTCRLAPVLGTQHAALPAPPQQTSERLKLELPSPPSPPVQVTAASAARQQSCLPSFATFPSRRPGSTWSISNNHSADQGAEDGTPGYDSSASLSRRKTARLDRGRTPRRASAPVTSSLQHGSSHKLTKGLTHAARAVLDQEMDRLREGLLGRAGAL